MVFVVNVVKMASEELTENEVINVVLLDDNKSDDELLISLVKSYPHLWDKSNKDYKNIDKRNISWNEISSTLSVSPETCQKRWQRLREYYSKERAKKEKETKIGNAASLRNQWVLYESLDFLNNHVRRRTSFRILKRKPSYHSDSEENNTQNENALFSYNGSSSPSFTPNDVNFKCSIPSKKARSINTSTTPELTNNPGSTSVGFAGKVDGNIYSEMLHAFNEIQTTINNISKDILKSDGDPRDHALCNLILRELQAAPESKKSRLRKKLYSVIIDFLEDQSDN